MKKSDEVTILRKANGQALIRIETLDFPLPGYIGIRHEWWNDIKKMEQGIPEENGVIFCLGYAGCNEKELIKRFDTNVAN